MDEKTQKPRFLRQYLAASIATLGAFSIGTIFGWSAPAEPWILEYGQVDYTIDGDQFAWAVSLMALGGAIISIPTGLIVDKIGARKTLLLFVFPVTVGWAFIIWSKNVAMLLVGRLFNGFGAGAFCMAVPIYIGETASREIRGTLGSFFQQMINLGVLYAYSVGNALNLFLLSACCGMAPIVYGVLFFFMPDSPTHWISHDNEPRAVESIKWLRGSGFDASTEVDEIRNHQRPVNLALGENRSVWKSLRQPATVRALVTMLGLMFFMQMSGLNVVLFYSTSIFQATNVAIEPELATIIIGGMQVLGTLFSSLVVDRAGRRLLLLASGSVMFVSVLTLGIYLQLLDNQVVDEPTSDNQMGQQGWLPVAALCLYVTLFSVGFGPVPWLMLGEVFASDVKGPASALANMTSFACSFVLSRLFPLARNSIGIGPTFMIFAGFCLLGVGFVAFVVPETKGKSLNEIQTMLAASGSMIACKVNK